MASRPWAWVSTVYVRVRRGAYQSRGYARSDDCFHCPSHGSYFLLNAMLKTKILGTAGLQTDMFYRKWRTIRRLTCDVGKIINTEGQMSQGRIR